MSRDQKIFLSDWYGWRSPLPDDTCNELVQQQMKRDFENFANLKTSNSDNFKSNDIIFLLNNENLDESYLTDSGQASMSLRSSALVYHHQH